MDLGGMKRMMEPQCVDHLVKKRDACVDHFISLLLAFPAAGTTGRKEKGSF